jgi:opacity protein-like surface antigen
MLEITDSRQSGENTMPKLNLSAGAIIALATTSIFLTLVTAGIISTQTIPSNGTVTTVNVGVYTDNQCTQNCTSINWGSLYPGNSTSKMVYVKNIGTVPITLSMNSVSWAPTNASECLTLSWNQQGMALGVGASVSANLTLLAASDTGNLSSFSVDIVITGAE